MSHRNKSSPRARLKWKFLLLFPGHPPTTTSAFPSFSYRESSLAAVGRHALSLLIWELFCVSQNTQTPVCSFFEGNS